MKPESSRHWVFSIITTVFTLNDGTEPGGLGVMMSRTLTRGNGLYLTAVEVLLNVNLYLRFSVFITAGQLAFLLE